MPGSVSYIGVSPNSLSWVTESITGQEFEDYIFAMLVSNYSNRRDNIQVIQTPKSRDGGKDIIVKSKTDFDLFGIPIKKLHKEEIKIYIECKSTSKQRIRLDSFGKNYLQTRQSNIDCFVLVTNGSISPYAFYLTKSAFEDNEIDFIVVDEFLLRKSFQDSNLSIDSSSTFCDDYDDVVIEYQSEKRSEIDSLKIDLFLWARNYSKEVKPCRLYLQSDKNWQIEDPDLSFYLEPYSTKALKLKAKREYNDGRKSLEIGLNLNGENKVLQIEADSITLDFTPRLFGNQHHLVIKKIIEVLDHNYSYSLISLSGEAGVGKTRILDEVIEQRNAGNIKIVRIYLEQNKVDKGLENLCTLIDKQFKTNYCDQDKSPSILRTIVENFDSDFYSLVIILEDMHHADPSICKTIKSLQSIKRKGKSPLCIILTGRNDYTFPNEDYYTLLELFNLRQNSKNHFCFNITPLSVSDTKNLIRSCVENVPEVALERIHQLSMNIPFNVIQAVEYLLETDLVKIINRNTVGIINIQKFSSKDLLPSSMEEIFTLRFKSLNKSPNGAKVQEFLMVASLFGFTFPNQVKEYIFDLEDQTSIDRMLIGRRFIILNENTTHWYHENLYQFFCQLIMQLKQEKHCAKFIISRPGLFFSLDSLEKGRIACLAEEYELCLEYFQPIISEIEKVDNFSSENINPNYFKYIDHLYNALNTQSRNTELPKKVLLAKSYLGIHSLPLHSGIKVCQDSRRKIKNLNIDKIEINVLDYSLRQLEAHACLNLGWIAFSKKNLTEIECAIQLYAELQDKSDLKFDVYNRLQDLYRQYCHLDLAKDYGLLAEKVAIEAENEKMLSVHKIGTAIIYKYIDPEKCHQLSLEAFEYTKLKGAERHKCFAELGLKEIEVSLHKNDSSELKKLRSQAFRLLKVCLMNNYSTAISRAYLLLSVICFLLGKKKRSYLNEAKKFIDLGINSSVQSGIGSTIWQLYNIQAVLFASERKPTDTIFKTFNTAVEHLKTQDLLFLGNLDFCHSNLVVISNYIAFLKKYDTEEVLNAFLNQLSYYNNHEIKSLGYYNNVNSSVEKSGVILQGKKPKSLIQDNTTNYYLSLF